jgi:DNA repair photolyase
VVPLDNPPNPWHSQQVDYLGQPPGQELSVYEDHSQSILTENDSPDLGFRYSVNPYRGCQHACAYCYARPSHQYLGFGAGTDFERRIAIKPRAPELLRQAFERPSWTGELVLFSGNTDCYQPLEASYELTRRCLEVCAEYRNPVQIVTKAALIERDIELIARLTQDASAGVSFSIPFWNQRNARALEPAAPTPRRRIETVRRLAAAGIPVTVNVAPVIPGLSEPDIPQILAAAAEAGARRASMIVLRLPGPVQQVFVERLRRALPLRAEKVLARTRELRGGKLYDARFGERMQGQGEYYVAIRTLFQTSARRLGLVDCDADAFEPQAASQFRRPTDRRGQLRLFE